MAFAMSTGSASRAMAFDRKSAPARMRPIIEQVRTVPRSEPQSVRSVSVRWPTAMRSAPRTPIAPASVTEAKPPYMEPITKRMRKTTGPSSARARIRSPHEGLGSGAGISSGDSVARMPM